jgi:hypothetical protein
MVCCITTVAGGDDVRASLHQCHAPESPVTHSTAATAHLQARTADSAGGRPLGDLNTDCALIVGTAPSSRCASARCRASRM